MNKGGEEGVEIAHAQLCCSAQNQNSISLPHTQSSQRRTIFIQDQQSFSSKLTRDKLNQCFNKVCKYLNQLLKYFGMLQSRKIYHILAVEQVSTICMYLVVVYGNQSHDKALLCKLTSAVLHINHSYNNVC